jgi:hypothetical protein
VGTLFYIGIYYCGINCTSICVCPGREVFTCSIYTRGYPYLDLMAA